MEQGNGEEGKSLRNLVIWGRGFRGFLVFCEEKSEKLKDTDVCACVLLRLIFFKSKR